MSLIDTLSWLVDLPSPTGLEGPLCDGLRHRLSAAYGPRRIRRIGNSLVVGARGDRPLLLLVGHIDTVPSQGQAPAHIENGRLYGLGASDMKAGIAVMLHLMEDPKVRNGRYDIVGVFYDAEEGPNEQNGLEPVLKELSWLSQAEFAVVLEPTDLELQLGCQGTANATVRFTGRSAHSARPWLGENAITKAGEWLAELHQRKPTEHVLSGLSFFELFSITKASAGIARNVIPGTFDLHLNYRFPPHLSPALVSERLAAVTEPADEVVVHEVVAGAPIPEGNPHLDRLEDSTRARRTPKQAWTDVARLYRYGIPAVNYGPGEVAQAHQATESVPVKHLEDAYRRLSRFLRAAPGG